MRELKEKEIAVQIWSKDYPEGDIKPQVEKVASVFKERGLNITEVEGPTYHIPDYFSAMFGFMAGWILYIADEDPVELKKIAMELEVVDGNRVLDIDIYLDYFTTIHRKDLE